MNLDPATQLPVIAVPESRELETMSLLLKNRGLPVLEVPLVSILDAPDPQPVVDWLTRFSVTPPALLILLTGEGLRRLVSRAEQSGLRDQFVTALTKVPALCRGPKPERVLRELGLQAQFQADTPTSAGVLATAQRLSLAGKRVALQLYGDEPNLLLVEGLQKLGATVDAVAPYIYASKEDEERVVEFIRRLSDGKVGVVAFTSQSQYKRLQDVANKRQLVEALDRGLRNCVLAAVGPVVKEQLCEAGYQVSVMPERVYFMKPLVMAIVRYLEENGVTDIGAYNR